MLKLNKILKSIKTNKPTSTIIVSDVNMTISDNELKICFEDYGFTNLQRINNSKYALIEFESIVASSEFLEKSNCIKINESTCTFDYSLLSIDEYNTLMDLNAERKPCKVLHLLISKATYSVTCDVIYNLCVPICKIARIVIDKKDTKEVSIDALIEFETIDDAIAVKDSLNGTEIYSGCCSLSFTFSRIQTLLVDKNDSESYDYSPKFDSPLNPYLTQLRFPFNYPYAPIYHPIPPHPPHFGMMHQKSPFYFYKHPNKVSYRRNWFIYSSNPTIRESDCEGLVLHCRNLNTKLTVENVFNWFCLYGNVVRIHKDSASSALIQMANREGARFARDMLDGLWAFGNYLHVIKTKLKDIADKCPSSDYSSDIHNRFRTTHQAGGKRHRVFGATKTLHFFNVPDWYTAEDVVNVFVSKGAAEPDKAVVFPKTNNTNNNNNNNNNNSSSGTNNSSNSNSNSNKSKSTTSGLIEFDSVIDAIEAIAIVNHALLQRNRPGSTNSNSNNNTGGQSQQLCHLRLVFSPVLISEEQGQKILASSSSTSASSVGANHLSGISNKNGNNNKRFRRSQSREMTSTHNNCQKITKKNA